MPRKDFRVANPEWGTKRTCKKCAVRFYDLNRAPVVCPKCGTHHVDKPLAKASAGAKAPPLEPRNTKPKMNDEAAQAMDVAVANDDDGDEEKEEDDVAEVLDIRDDPVKE